MERARAGHFGTSRARLSRDQRRCFSGDSEMKTAQPSQGMHWVVILALLASRGVSPPAAVRAETAEATAGQTASLLSEAQARMNAGDYAAAAQLYQQALAGLPASVEAQQAALKAGMCMDAMQQPAQAIEMYDRVVATSRDVLKTSGPRTPRNLAVVQDPIERALYRKALACQQIGDSACGLQAIRHLRAVGPTSVFITRLVPLQLAFEERPASLAETLIQQEQQATALWEQARQASRSAVPEQALPVLDRMLTEYPGTAVALRAKAQKARILWSKRRWDEAKQLYQEIINQVGDVGSESDYAYTARFRLALSEPQARIKELERQVRSGAVVSASQWEQVRDACTVIMQKDFGPSEIDDAHVIVMEAYAWEGRYEELAAATAEFFQKCPAVGGCPQRLPLQEAWAHFFAGYAMESLSRYEEAAAHYRGVLQVADRSANALLGNRVVGLAEAGLKRTATHLQRP